MGGEVREMATPYSNQKVLILGAGVTGNAVAKALSKRGALIGIVDENKDSVIDYPRIDLDSIDLDQWDSIVVSPGCVITVTTTDLSTIRVSLGAFSPFLRHNSIETEAVNIPNNIKHPIIP
jgi:shikimate 5-dehydrogenase